MASSTEHDHGFVEASEVQAPWLARLATCLFFHRPSAVERGLLSRLSNYLLGDIPKIDVILCLR